MDVPVAVASRRRPRFTKDGSVATPEVEDIFTDILERAKALDPANTRKWFEKLTVLHLDGGSLVVSCPDDATVAFLRDNCRSNFTRAAQHVTGHLITVDFSTEAYEELRVRSTRIEAGRRVSAAPEKQGMGTLKLHPDYTFDSFVVGPSNRLAHASCIAVSQSPGNTYNPLFVYGSSGLGKTHLLHAVCFEIQRNLANAAIQLLSCEDFVNKFIRAIEEGNLAGFQKQFRTADAIVIDDIQFLREREHSQEEFFHTFNALYNNGKQIILSADSEERLISRFNWGLVARIDPPSYETRVAIVQKKAHLRGLDISEEIAGYIARDHDGTADRPGIGPDSSGGTDRVGRAPHKHNRYHRGGDGLFRRSARGFAEQETQSEHYRTAADLHVPGPESDQAQPRRDRRPPGRARPYDGHARLQQDYPGQGCRPEDERPARRPYKANHPDPAGVSMTSGRRQTPFARLRYTSQCRE